MAFIYPSSHFSSCSLVHFVRDPGVCVTTPLGPRSGFGRICPYMARCDESLIVRNLSPSISKVCYSMTRLVECKPRPTLQWGRARPFHVMCHGNGNEVEIHNLAHLARGKLNSDLVHVCPSGPSIQPLSASTDNFCKEERRFCGVPAFER